MALIIPDNILQSARLSANELKIEVAILLYQQKKITLGQASNFLEVSQLDFQEMLADREIPVHYSISDLHDDMRTIQELNL